MHIRDKDLLVAVHKFFGVGKIYVNKSTVYYSVRSINDLVTVVSHFEKHPLQTSKAADFMLFCKAMHIMKNKGHLTPSGLQIIVAIKASINWGINEVLSTAFPDTLPVERPAVVLTILSGCPSGGFTTGEGCFYVIVGESSSTGLEFVYDLILHNIWKIWY